MHSPFTWNSQASLPKGQQLSTPPTPISYPVLPNKPNHNGSNLPGLKAAWRSPPSTLVLSLPLTMFHIHPIPLQFAGTLQPHPSFPHYQILLRRKHLQLTFHKVQQHLEIFFQMLLLEMQTPQLQKEFWDLNCTSVTNLWKQYFKILLRNPNIHSNCLVYFSFFFFLKWAREEKGHAQSQSYRTAVGQS